MREVEVKFRVDPDFDLPDLAADGALPALDGRRVAARRQGRFTLRATYYDTEDLRLARAGITLRRRTGGTDEGWHLKLPTGQEGVREEITWTPATGRTPPAQLLDLVAARVRQAPVHAVATVVTTRTSVLLSDGNSAVLAEVADDAVRVMDGNRVSARFREVEVEDLGGGTDVLAAVGRVLEAAGAVPGGTDSKLARALGARAQAPADPPPPPQAGRD
ncbi:MAG: inorganic triphosphatase, partial [Actinomycetes bacterium]